MPLNDIQRRIKRSKQSERDLGKWLLKNDGEDPKWRHITSSTGRVGFVTGLQFDVVSKTYAAENKQQKLPQKWLQVWLQILDIALRHDKEALLVIEPTNLPVGSRKIIPKWHVITQERHEYLLECERKAWMYDELG